MPIYFVIFAKDFHAVGGQEFQISKLASWRYIGRKMPTRGNVSDGFNTRNSFVLLNPLIWFFFTKPSPYNNDGI